MSTRPYVARDGTVWAVYLGARQAAAFGDRDHALAHAERIATRKARARVAQHLYRIRTAIQRMEAKR